MINQLLQGRYQVIRELGKGAFGQTYIAQDTQYPGKPYCVVKHLQHDDPRNLEKVKQLFLREAEILAKLGNHDQIPELKAYSETQFYLVQEFVDGHPLRDEMPPAKIWAENDVVSLLQDILPVLVFIHDLGVIHRDIKPDNIMRRQRDNKLVLIDFGAIKEKVLNSPDTGASTIAGSRIYTLGYAPPEQTVGKPHFSSDIYALGMTVIEALTGESPHLLQDDDDTGEIIWQNKASVSPGLAEIITKIIRYRRQDRYQSAGEVLQALQQLMLASQSQATNSSGVVNQLTLEWQEAGEVRNTIIRDNQPSKNPGTIRIGRDSAQCDLVFSDLSVSGLHIEILFDRQQRQFYVRNLRQTNPPIVNGKPLPTGEMAQMALSPGSNVQLGQINLRVIAITLDRVSAVTPTTELATVIKPTELATAYQSPAVIKPTKIATTYQSPAVIKPTEIATAYQSPAVTKPAKPGTICHSSETDTVTPAREQLSIFKGGFKEPPRGEDLRLDLAIGFDDAILGCELEIRIPRLEMTNEDELEQVIKSLKVNIPAGVNHGSKLRLKEQGDACRHGGKPGDLYLFLLVPSQDKERKCDTIC